MTHSTERSRASTQCLILFLSFLLKSGECSGGSQGGTSLPLLARQGDMSSSESEIHNQLQNVLATVQNSAIFDGAQAEDDSTASRLPPPPPPLSPNKVEATVSPEESTPDHGAEAKVNDELSSEARDKTHEGWVAKAAWESDTSHPTGVSPNENEGNQPNTLSTPEESSVTQGGTESSTGFWQATSDSYEDKQLGAGAASHAWSSQTQTVPGSGTQALTSPTNQLASSSLGNQFQFQDSSQQPLGSGAHSFGQNENLQPYNYEMHQNQYSTSKRSRKPLSSITSGWKSLWGKVEKRLDQLAKVEDAMNSKAKKLVSSVTSSSSSSRTPDRPIGPAPPFRPGHGHVSPVSETTHPGQPQQQQAQSNSASARRADWGSLGQTNVAAPTTVPEKTKETNLSPLPSGISQSTTSTAQPPQGKIQASVLPSSDNRQTQSTAQRFPQGNQPQARRWNALEDNIQTSPIPQSSVTARGTISSSKNEPLRDLFEDDERSWTSRLSRALPPIPRLRSPAKMLGFNRGSSYAYAGMDAWQDEEDKGRGRGIFGFFRGSEKVESLPVRSARSVSRGGDDQLAPILDSMMGRCQNGKTASLLATTDKKRCGSLGKIQAIFDMTCIAFVLLGLQQATTLLSTPLPTSLDEVLSTTLPALGAMAGDSMQTWAPIFFGYAYLARVSERSLLKPRIEAAARSVSSAVESESQYAQLYMRLAAAIPMDSKLPAKLGAAAASQARSLISSARLSTFVSVLLVSLCVMTISLGGQFFLVLSDGFSQLASMNEWRTWPIPWETALASSQEILRPLMHTLQGLIMTGLTSFLDNPMQFAFHLSIVGSMMVASLIPKLARRKGVTPANDDEEDVSLSSSKAAQLFGMLGASSASRLSMLSENGSIENALDRWRATQVDEAEETVAGVPNAWFRQIVLSVLAALVTVFPIIVSQFIAQGSSHNVLSHPFLRWDSALDVSVVMFAVFLLVQNSIAGVSGSTGTRSMVANFVSTLRKTLDEMRDSSQRQTNIQFMASISPTAGLMVKDLWVAHTTKRAWAVRGANLHCKNGEILAVLGDDGSGKTRLLTAIAENLLAPPKRSMTSNKVRGYVCIGGVDASKWDKGLLKRRLGVLLSDVRTVADTANLYSGCTMEEMLEPIHGLKTADPSHKLSPAEKSAMVLALKITGLYSTLLPRLSAKLSTVITANEEDLSPSPFRPRSHVMSPAEWSKLMLTKVLAQTVFDNDNAAASSDRAEKSLVGSVLLLDDPTVLLSEVEEAKILRELRQTGAATILTTNKWATGRFVDRIVVVKDGAIVESGTHSELIAMGPQQSFYAAKWHAMTMQ